MGRVECGSSLESLEGEIEAVRSFVFVGTFLFFFFFGIRKDKICRVKS